MLLPNDLFRISDGDNLVLVIDSESFGFQKSIREYFDDSQLMLHSRMQNGCLKCEFLMKVVAFSIRDQYLNGLISFTDQLNRYNQGDGLSLCSREYPGLRYNVRLKDVFGGKVQLFERTSPSFNHPSFFEAAGRSQDPRMYGPIYHSFLNMVNGDSEQTLRVL